MAKKMTGKNTGQKGKTEIKTAGAEILLRRTLHFISITPLRIFLPIIRERRANCNAFFSQENGA